MALYETREVACYLRNGSVWIGRFVVTSAGLNFGDDRFDAAHGLANLLYADVTPTEADALDRPCTQPANIGQSDAPDFKLAA